jgi:hypothetical protein
VCCSITVQCIFSREGAFISAKSRRKKRTRKWTVSLTGLCELDIEDFLDLRVVSCDVEDDLRSVLKYFFPLVKRVSFFKKKYRFIYTSEAWYLFALDKTEHSNLCHVTQGSKGKNKVLCPIDI